MWLIEFINNLVELILPSSKEEGELEKTGRFFVFITYVLLVLVILYAAGKFYWLED